MEFGADVDKPDKPNEVTKRRAAFELERTEETVESRRRTKGAQQVMSLMEALMMDVICAQPQYRNNRVIDNRAFGRYLNDTFFGREHKALVDESAHVPISVQQVLGMVTQFMDDLRWGRFALKEGQPVWKAFAARWHNYSSQPAEISDRLRELQAQEIRAR